MTELDSLLVRITGDASSYLASLKESESATRQTASRMEGATTAATRQVATSQEQLAKSYATTSKQALDSAAAQSTASRASVEAGKAAKDAGEETAKAGGKASGLGDGLKGIRAGIAPLLAAGAAAFKLAEALSELISNTAAFRKEMLEAERATDRQIAAMQRMANSRLQALGRSDAPLEKRLEAFDTDIEKAKKASDAAADSLLKLQEAQQTRKNIGRGAGAAVGAAAGTAFAPGIGTAIGAVGGFFLGPQIDALLNPQDRKRQEQAIDAAKKQMAQTEAELKALEDQRQQLIENIKNQAFQAQAASREQIALARTPEHLRESERLKRLGATPEDVKKTAELGTEAMTTKFAADTEKATRMLDLQAKNVRANAAELRVLEMELEGVSGAQLEMARTAAQANKFAEMNTELKKFVASLEEETAAIGKSGIEAELARRRVRGFTEEQLAALKPALQLRRGAELTEQFRLPQEKFKTQLGELNELLAAGAIKQDTYGRAVADARKQLLGEGQALAAIQGAAQGSAEALERFNKYQDAIALKPLPDYLAGAGGLAAGNAPFQPGGGMNPPPQPMEKNPPPMQDQKEQSQYLKDIRDTLWRMEKREGPQIAVGGGF